MYVYYSPPLGLGLQGTEHPYTYIATDARFDGILYGAIGGYLFRMITPEPEVRL